ncbi:MAG: right-handed parallel beta-helix repeat-containing protein [Nitrospiraceae bacterium]|nr:right-handed parallel beta-helix repeat-containing protein [Nitrospiraceae bacterium]
MKRLFLIVAAVFYLLGGAEGLSFGATYYVAKNGSGNADGSRAHPWANFSQAVDNLKPGDALIIKDGVYFQPLFINVSGEPGRPITVKAENDGKVIIDGRGLQAPCRVEGTKQKRVADVELSGLQCRNSNIDVVRVHFADRIVVSRVSAYGASPGISDNAVFDLAGASHVTIKDCAASGRGRVLYNAQSCDYVIFRRCWGKWMDFPLDIWLAALQIYGTSHSIVENCVFTTNSKRDVTGITVIKQTYNEAADDNRIYGNVIDGFKMYGIITASYGKRPLSGNIFKDNVIVGSTYGFGLRTGGTVENSTFIDASSCSFCVSKSDPGLPLYGRLKGSSLYKGNTGINLQNADSFKESENNLFGFVNYYRGLPGGRADTADAVRYALANYGKGAYLIPAVLSRKAGQTTGAQVLYRYESGVLTNVPLWPWPMEERIKREAGCSVTWENGGGLWKTLDKLYPSAAGRKAHAGN